MKTANDYLAEKVQSLELSSRVSEASSCYWQNKAVSLMKEKGMTIEEITKEFEIALKDGIHI